MAIKNNIRYIVVLFVNGIGYTLQTDNKPHIFFERYAKTFKSVGWAFKAANKVGRKYKHDYMCIFKVQLEERLSCDVYKSWLKDEGRVVVNTKYDQD